MGIDHAVWSYMISLRSEWLTTLVVPFTLAFTPRYVLLYSALWSAWRARRTPPLQAVFPLLAVGFAVSLSPVFKALIGRERPPIAEQLLYHFNPSMPSGHAVAAFALATVISYLSTHAWVQQLAWCVAVLVALSRLYVGVHWLSDVLVGGAMGVIAVWLIWSACRFNQPNSE